MIQVFSQTHERLCLLSGYQSLKIRQKLADGDKQLSFRYPRSGSAAGYLKNENYLQTKEDEFVLKEISSGKEWREYTAVLNLEDLKGKSFLSFETVEKTAAECLGAALQGTGWTVGWCDVKKRRTIRKENICTALDIISQCVSTYKCEVMYHSRARTIDICGQIGGDRGVYFMEALNLRQMPSMASSTNGLYTQIRPIGKDGLKINIDGKDYIENHSYSPKNIMLTWKDERYTNASYLAEDAALKLAEICRPVRTYEVDVIDLASQSEEYGNILAYGIGDVVTLVSRTEGIKEKMRIVVIEKYPEEPQKNSCQLSTAKKTFADVQQEAKEAAVAEATAIAAARTSQSIEKESGTASKETEQKLESLKTGILESVAEAFLAKGDAQSLAESAADAAAERTAGEADRKLEDYVTRKQAERDIESAKETILQAVAQEYAKAETVRVSVETVRQEAERMASAVREDAGARIAELEASKNDIVDGEGVVWRMKVEEGSLRVERVEAEG